ncbi:dTMP kinase [Natronosalvus caseinilyticus]|uniref:dTMP kinase n=1 Tax=Natronosalvus caseinilyticus TaxID=2953747 RepID=UPI0028AF99B9|nr:dTMP kinase [Natronosalvus caseinilyticus]
MLVTLEGLDGTGKTTVWEALHDVYPDATFTREPTSGETGSWYGKAVYRSIEDDDADSLAELFLYTADHADHLSRVIEPALKRGDLVISDRYSDSRYAYQGATLEGRITRPMEYIVGIHRAFTTDPDLTIYLDLDPETAAARAGATNKFEHAAYLSQVRANYERLLENEPDRFVRVDASQPPEDVLEAVESVLADRLEADTDADPGANAR